ncbi:MAG: hypothetical protein AAF549_05685 [Pseudomonadota bacterium]
MSMIQPIDFEEAVLVIKRIDPIVPRLTRLMNEVGFVFPPGRDVPERAHAKLNHCAYLLTDDEWQSLPYPFLKEDMEVLVELSLGVEVFGSKAIEALDSICGDFFALDDTPRNKALSPI